MRSGTLRARDQRTCRPTAVNSSTATASTATVRGPGAQASLRSRVQDIHVLATGSTTSRYSWTACSVLALRMRGRGVRWQAVDPLHNRRGCSANSGLPVRS